MSFLTCSRDSGIVRRGRELEGSILNRHAIVPCSVGSEIDPPWFRASRIDFKIGPPTRNDGDRILKSIRQGRDDGESISKSIRQGRDDGESILKSIRQGGTMAGRFWNRSGKVGTMAGRF